MTMKAAIKKRTDQPYVIEVQKVPMPEVKSGWVLIHVKAFGLNCS